jgi:nitrogen fixation/metabolism regulation signal transduction histidine kinase
MKTQLLTGRSDLRQRAEEISHEKELKLSLDATKSDFLAINHELLVHQIELEMQNDELEKANENAEQISEKYIDLYNLAPTGYITLTKEGEITEANYSAYNLLERNQTKLVGSRLGFFVTDASRPVFNQFIEDLLKTKETETCVIAINTHENEDRHILLTGHTTRDDKHCLIAVIDISELVADEKKIKQLEYFNGIFVDRELKMIELKKEINLLLEKAGLQKKY